jgi:glycosyltransferase involved in cell wall biosynthesis
MPIFNAAQYLAEAIESILAQTFAEFEFIIVDDGSNDTSLNIISQYATRDSRIRVISRANTGIAGACNDGIALARGEFLARMDADDISLPTRFALQVDFLDAHPSCVAVGASGWFMDPDGDVIGLLDSKTDHVAIMDVLAQGNGAAVPHPVSMLRASAVRAVGGYQAEFSDTEDLDLFFRLARVGTLANLPARLLLYRQHLASANYSRARRTRKKVAAILQREKVSKFFENLVFAEIDVDNYELFDMTTLRFDGGMARIALANGFLHTAHKHAFRVLRQKPLSTDSWRLMKSVYVKMVARTVGIANARYGQ